MVAVRRLGLFWHTARHLSRRQVTTRIGLRTGEALRDASPGFTSWFYGRLARRHGEASLPSQFRLNADRVRRSVSGAEAEVIRAEARRMLGGEFSFVGHRASLGSPINWSAPNQSRLWKYQLHQFDYLVPISVVDTEPGGMVRSLVESWIAANPIGGATSRDAWHPFVVSVRLVNWMLALAALGGRLPRGIADSLALHAAFLERNLEYDVGGNHLLKNLKALVFAASSAGTVHLEEASAVFAAELARQLLNDGCHVERTPMYHAIVLTDAQEVQALLACLAVKLPASLLDDIARMRAFLRTVTHPDGELALFKDTALDGVCTPSQIHGFAEALDGQTSSSVSLRHQLLLPPASERVSIDAERPAAKPTGASSGYFTLQSSDRALWLLCDAGVPCPDNLPAHAHADMLSYECDVRGSRLIVDSGVGEYAGGQWRDYYRSTAAHNTVVVDEVDQSECWSSFRVARRARPVDVRTHAGVAIHGLDASHTGYERLPGAVRHRRRIALVADRFYLVVDDLGGAGAHSWSSYIHAHPEARFQSTGPCSARLTRGSAALHIVWAGPVQGEITSGAMRPLTGWRADRFGSPREAATLALRGQGVMPARIAYALVPEVDAVRAQLAIEERDRFVIDMESMKYSVELRDTEWQATAELQPTHHQA